MATPAESGPRLVISMIMGLNIAPSLRLQLGIFQVESDDAAHVWSALRECCGEASGKLGRNQLLGNNNSLR